MNWNSKLKAAALCSGFIFISLDTEAQNLVPNGNFETYSACPDSAAGSVNISLATPWVSPSTFGYTDYANSCANSYETYCSVPLNVSGGSYQVPHSGQGYGGFFAYGSDAYDIRQYAEVKLNDSLIAGHCYYVSFYVSLMNYAQGGINNIAAAFTHNYVTSISQDDALIPATPNIQLYGNPVITDTLNWTHIDGIYTATGGEQYITIGNFKDDQHTTTQWLPGLSGPFIGYIPYYLDDVSVEEVTASMPSANAGRDTAINAGDSVFIGTLTSGLTTQWTDGSGNVIATNVPGLWVHPSGSTSYVLQQTVCGFTTTDTVNVDVWPLGIRQANSAQGFKIFPNPTMGIFNISLPQPVNWYIAVTDLQGRAMPLEQQNALSGSITIKVNAPAGIYIVRIVNKTTGEIIDKKLILNNN